MATGGTAPLPLRRTFRSAAEALRPGTPRRAIESSATWQSRHSAPVISRVFCLQGPQESPHRAYRRRKCHDGDKIVHTNNFVGSFPGQQPSRTPHTARGFGAMLGAGARKWRSAYLLHSFTGGGGLPYGDSAISCPLHCTGSGPAAETAPAVLHGWRRKPARGGPEEDLLGEHMSACHG
jgi:hypothetical protein